MNLLKPSGTKDSTVQVTGVLLDELKALVPGQVYRLEGRDGRRYAILDWEDLEHIMGRAAMTTQGKSGSQT